MVIGYLIDLHKSNPSITRLTITTPSIKHGISYFKRSTHNKLQVLKEMYLLYNL